MKKEYIEPKIMTIDITPCQIICTSLPGGGDASANGVTTADSPEGYFDF